MNNINLKNASPCPHCNHLLEFHDAAFILYFNSKDIICPKCNKILNLWSISLNTLEWIDFGLHYALLGCQSKMCKIDINPNEYNTLDLSKDIGNGDLLYVNVTLEGGEEATIPMCNVNAHPELFKFKQISLYGMPQNENPNKSNANVFYWFAPEEVKEDLANMQLLDAFKFYYEGNYRYMIISAHSAVEILFSKFIEKILISNSVGKDKTEGFLKHAATYSYQLKTLMPFVCEIMDFPKLNNQIFEGLENLRKDRNELIHDGITGLSDKARLKRELISAFFAFKYFKIIHDIK